MKPYRRYHIASEPAGDIAPHPGRFRVRVNRWRLAELLLKEVIHYRVNLPVVVSRPCVYGVFSGPIGGFAARSHLCVGCLRCTVQYPEIVQIHPNPDRLRLGDSYFTPDKVDTVLYEAATGRVPVRGAGYRGAFGGAGWDGMWTDMSEIVRPTRDGIHGREFISTAVDLGEKPSFLPLDAAGAPAGPLPRTVSLPVPFLFDPPPRSAESPALYRALSRAAERVETLAVVPLRRVLELGLNGPSIVPLLTPSELEELDRLAAAPFLLELDGWDESAYTKLRKRLPDSLVFVRLGFETDLLPPVRAGVRLFHLIADYHGSSGHSFALDAIRRAHTVLVGEGMREEATLIGSGGIIAAEHVPKAIICGLDAVALDTPLLIALQARFEGECRDRAAAAVRLPDFDPGWATQRLMNLAASWRDQLLEILGAMGLREVRRLRGETGRAMFQADLDQEAFAGIAGHGAEMGEGEARLPGSECFRMERTGGGGMAGRGSPEPATGTGAPAAESQRSALELIVEKHVEALHRGFRRWPERSAPPPALGDLRWTADLILSTWVEAETGSPPLDGLEYRKGASEGGFDRLDFLYLPESEWLPPRAAIDLSLPLNRRSHDARIEIPVPWYGAGMSYGSVSEQVMLARAIAARRWNTFTCTGEGGYPDSLFPYRDHVITQVATGMFGVREETVQWARVVEFKYAQGAKPGLGGHLLGDKATMAVARMRESVPWVSLFSPFPFHSVYSVEDHRKHVDWVKTMNPEALVSVKVSTPTDIDMVAVGSYYAGAHILQIDGSYGGTGAAPEIAKKNIAMPIEYAIPRVHRYLLAEGIRDEMVVMASGGIRTAYDVAKAIALGADGCVLGTVELVALGCTRCANCERGRGCPFGLTTTDPELSLLVDPEWGAERISNLYSSMRAQLREILRRLGLERIRDLRGRTDLLLYRKGDLRKDQAARELGGDTR